MNVFWEKIIYPILLSENSKRMVEVGCEYGINTVNLLSYAYRFSGHVTVIDPFLSDNVRMLMTQAGSFMDFIPITSLEALPQLTDYDVIFLDGDHNWYTIYHELKIIEAKAVRTGKFPLVLMHDVCWPYARRDMYYNPETIPPEYLLPYAKKGILHGVSELASVGGANAELNNAIYENGVRNGVLTGVEDFMKQTTLSLTFHLFPRQYGLGIIGLQDRRRDALIQQLMHICGEIPAS
ncbi:class I SAM-dependent methyltransferase [Paenibacillus sp. N1-5-1-14]|uniref:class I SAM-dependent methyltransferase n=1 Tax=Paenibacillus radicibacter TaxID=2972488 RepID=UPI0021599EB2|nr:class I SAM-dependent methyltransferase [Paenibacillus radicibacter]MCR8644024.1 class I SAM-dependent methyltransferase [Paenibacillus radicibacter]